MTSLEVPANHHILSLLKHLQSNPYPEIPSPESAKRRASVALIIRFRPSYNNWPSPGSASASRNLEDFFAQTWVQNGEPEILFIKRASRKGDRWTSHIALPGGKRDAEDVDDAAAAVRETWEEVGLDLQKHAIACGNLPQRILTTHWGKKPLMILCPYIYLLTSHDTPPLCLQPTEVAAAHWVPILSLQSPSRRTVVFEDVSSRLANDETGVKRWMLRMILGKMMFAAIALLPTESLHSADRTVQQLLQDNRLVPNSNIRRLRSLTSRFWTLDIFNQFAPLPPEGELLLWGLTLGVVSDFLDLLPPNNALTLWTYPTFAPLDVRLIIWLMTYRFKNRKRVELQAGYNPSFGYETESVSLSSTDVSATPSTQSVESSMTVVLRDNEAGLHGLGTGMGAGMNRSRKAAVATMLEGWVQAHIPFCKPEIADRLRYYDIVRRAVAVALLGRVSMFAIVAVITWRRLRKGVK